MEQLKIDPEFARRYVNEGFSGGEMKRAEILQMAMLRPKFAILDETDSGLDVDAVRLASQSIAQIGGHEMGILIITHHEQLLEYNQPDLHPRDARRADCGDRRPGIGHANCTSKVTTAFAPPIPRPPPTKRRWRPRLMARRTEEGGGWKSGRRRHGAGMNRKCEAMIRTWQPTSRKPDPRLHSKQLRGASTGYWTTYMPTDSHTDPIGEINKYDFRNDEQYVFKARKGLDRQVVAEISEMKGEPAWMREFRLKSLEIFESQADAALGRRHRHQVRGHLLLPEAHRGPGQVVGRRAQRDQDHLRPAGHPRGRKEVPRRRQGPVRERGGLRLAEGRIWPGRA